MIETEEEAYQAMLRHHHGLVDGVKSRSFAIGASLGSQESLGTRVADLVNFMELEVIPHAEAEEHSIYQVAVEVLELGELIGSMIDEHRQLQGQLEALKAVKDFNGDIEVAVVDAAKRISELFSRHVIDENEEILGRLLSNPDVDLVEVLREMEQLFGAAQLLARSPGAHLDREKNLVSVIIEFAEQLAQLGYRDLASKGTATAWSIVKDDHPNLANRLTAALHRFTSSAETGLNAPEDLVGPMNEEPELDVREMPAQIRHSSIFNTFRSLKPGSVFVLINDHDPKPLKYQFEAEHSGEFSWKYLTTGPEVWRVQIGKVK
jgi:uncharacterized protein (DUF2249 family)/hemerythrin-like domain-containing protein